MRIKRKSLMVGVLSASLILGGAGAATAETAYPDEGGTWDYGTSGSFIWSNYLHETRSHGSSVKNCHGQLWRSPNVLAGSWSNVSTDQGCPNWGDVDYAYYRVL